MMAKFLHLPRLSNHLLFLPLSSTPAGRSRLLIAFPGDAKHSNEANVKILGSHRKVLYCACGKFVVFFLSCHARQSREGGRAGQAKTDLCKCSAQLTMPQLTKAPTKTTSLQ